MGNSHKLDFQEFWGFLDIPVKLEGEVAIQHWRPGVPGMHPQDHCGVRIEVMECREPKAPGTSQILNSKYPGTILNAP